ncbi:jg21658 [Pararge aegeria aegeria]|uniref:Jg21658 protein n=1 Tax=Pararge aegeria aegeria TaxID=348720 RepID=A0A8S4RM99_9NEOP|nr:jg21658 [Pararge aegeria aegeria]
MDGAHGSENHGRVGEDMKVVQRGGQMKSNESLGAAGNERSRTVDFRTLYKGPMSSSGRQSVEVMLIMNARLLDVLKKVTVKFGPLICNSFGALRQSRDGVY